MFLSLFCDIIMPYLLNWMIVFVFFCILIFRNPGVRTIEEDLLNALSKAGSFPEEMKDNLGKVSRPTASLLS